MMDTGRHRSGSLKTVFIETNTNQGLQRVESKLCCVSTAIPSSTSTLKRSVLSAEAVCHIWAGPIFSFAKFISD